MPPIGKSSNKAVVKPGIGAYLNANLPEGTDEIEIELRGSDEPEEAAKVKAWSMSKVAQLVAGIRYLLKGWIPFGMLTMIIAPPGTGKSIFVLFAIIRPVILGGIMWFNQSKGPKKWGYVLLCDTEGTAAITIQRMKECGLPTERVLVPLDDPLQPIDLTNEEHLERVLFIIIKYKVKLVVIDSLRGGHDGDENSSRVTKMFQSLARIAERTGTAIVIIHHTRKLQFGEEVSADSSRGSNAQTAMVRVLIVLNKPDPNSPWIGASIVKENLGVKPAPIGFCIGPNGLEFGPPPAKPRNITARDQAEDWLKANMTPGKWYKAAQLLEDAEGDGFSETALRRARNVVGITKPNHVRKTNAGWEWMLPLPGDGKTAAKTGPKSATP